MSATGVGVPDRRWARYLVGRNALGTHGAAGFLRSASPLNVSELRR